MDGDCDFCLVEVAIAEEVLPDPDTESLVYGDDVKVENEKAIARFNPFRRIGKVWRFFQVLLAFGLISWSVALVQAVLNSASGFNRHSVFLLEVVLIASLFVLDHRNAVRNVTDGDQVELQNDCPLSPMPDSGNVENSTAVGVDAMSESDDVAVAMEKVLLRTQPEELKQEIAVMRPQPEFRTSETENRRETLRFDAAAMETLTDEEFKWTIDEFNAKHRASIRG